jgi:MFS family permease
VPAPAWEPIASSGGPGRAGGIRLYRSALRQPYVAQLVIGGLVGRLREGGIGLGIVLSIRHATGSFAIAGGAAAVFVGFATLGRPIQSRLSTVFGARAVLIAVAVAHSVAALSLAFCAAAKAAAIVLLIVVAVCGALLPATSAYLRASWPMLLPDDKATAYALDAVSYDVSNAIGPAIVAVLAQAANPPVALAALTLCGLIGTVIVATSPGPRPTKPDGSAQRSRLLRGAVGAVAAVTVFVAFGEGALTVAVPGVGALNHAAAASGYLLSAFAVGSLVGGLLSGARRWRSRPVARLACFAIAYAAGLTSLATTNNLVVLAVLILLTGVARAPIIATMSLLMDSAAPAAAAVEAFSWMSVASALGAAAGQTSSGILATADIRLSFLAAAVGVLGAAAIARCFLWRSP